MPQKRAKLQEKTLFYQNSVKFSLLFTRDPTNFRQPLFVMSYLIPGLLYVSFDYLGSKICIFILDVKPTILSNSANSRNF